MEQLGETVRKLILAGIGAVAVTKEKTAGVLEELVKQGELTVEQGKVLNEELKHNIKEAVRENVQVNVTTTADDLMNAVEDMDEEQLESLKQRIEAAQQARTAEESAAETEKTDTTEE